MGPFDVLPSTWHLSELIVKNNRVMVMHSIQEVGRVVYTTNLRLQLMWSLKLDQAPGSRSYFHLRTVWKIWEIFLPCRFYVKSILVTLESKSVENPEIYNYVQNTNKYINTLIPRDFCKLQQFSRKSILTILKFEKSFVFLEAPNFDFST